MFDAHSRIEAASSQASVDTRWRARLKRAPAGAVRAVNIDRVLWLLCLPLGFVGLVALSEEAFWVAMGIVSNVAEWFALFYSALLGALMFAGRWRSVRDLVVVTLLLALSSRLAANSGESGRAPHRSTTAPHTIEMRPAS